MPFQWSSPVAALRSAIVFCLAVEGAQPPSRSTLPALHAVGPHGEPSKGVHDAPFLHAVSAISDSSEANVTGVRKRSRYSALLTATTAKGLRAAPEEPEFDLDMTPSENKNLYPTAPTPEQRGDYNRETSWRKVTPWSEEPDDRYPFSVEAFIAGLWITTVAAMPFIVIKLDHKVFTRIQAIVFFIMWVILFGGVYLFTRVLYFQSNHFETVRHLTIVESVYFLSQVLTTVGYGDVVPANAKTQVFVALYVLFSLLVIANVISEVGECVSKHVHRLGTEVIQRIKQIQDAGQQAADRGMEFAGRRNSNANANAAGDGPTLTRTETWSAGLLETEEELLKRKPITFFDNKVPRLDVVSVLGALTQFLFFVVLGVCFYHNYPGEEKTVFNSVYMSVITLSTVGFGVVTPQTEAGKVFGAFWMLFGSGALIGLVSSLTELYSQIKTKEQWLSRDHEAEQKEFFQKCPQNMDKFEFFKLALLHKGAVKESDVDALEAIFERYQDSESRTLATEKLEELVCQSASPSTTPKPST